MILLNTQMMLKLDTQFKFIFYSPLLAHEPECQTVTRQHLRSNPFQILIKRGDDENK